LHGGISIHNILLGFPTDRLFSIGTVSASPLGSMPNLVALGTKDSGAGGFDDYGGQLEIHRLDFAERGLKCPLAGSVSHQKRLLQEMSQAIMRILFEERTAKDLAFILQRSCSPIHLSPYLFLIYKTLLCFRSKQAASFRPLRGPRWQTIPLSFPAGSSRAA
jgi:hypothetical protein